MSSSERIESIKRLIEDYEKKKEDLKRSYEQSVADIDNAVNKLKIELADIVLGGQSGTASESKKWATIVTVKFNDKGKTYDYLWDDPKEVKEGDMVEVETRWNGMQAVEVVRVFQVFKESEGYADYDYIDKYAFPLSEK